MARVEEWFGEFASRLVERSRRGDWPGFDAEADIEFWGDFKRALIRCGATFDEADEASSAACDVPNLWPNQFRPIVVAAIKGIQARKQAEQKGQGGGGANSVDEARAASKDCPDCGGNGLAIRFIHSDHLGRFASTRGIPFLFGSRVVLVCSSCPLGTMARRLNAEAPRESRHRMPSLADFPAMARPQYRYHPDDWDAVHDRPMPEPTADDVKAMVRRAVASGKAPRRPQERRPMVATIHEPPDPDDRVARAVAAREQASRQPAEYPALPESSERPISPAEQAEMSGWY